MRERSLMYSRELSDTVESCVDSVYFCRGPGTLLTQWRERQDGVFLVDR